MAHNSFMEQKASFKAWKDKWDLELQAHRAKPAKGPKPDLVPEAKAGTRSPVPAPVCVARVVGEGEPT